MTVNSEVVTEGLALPPLRSADAAAPWLRYSILQRLAFLAILFLVVTSTYLDCFVITVLLEPIKREFLLTDTDLGLLTGLAYSLCYSLTVLPIARVADRGNRRTAIAVALAMWSGMTALCGVAQSFWQLALARCGVGAAQAGSLPPSQSLIADYFPPEQRGRALAILNAAMNLGYVVGIWAGGNIAARLGWRAAFILVGAPGIALALIVRLTLAEPRTASGSSVRRSRDESVAQVFFRLKEKRSFVLSVIGLSLFSVFTSGSASFLPSFMIRILHSSFQQVSEIWGPLVTVANIVGALLGGWLADYLTKRDIRWYGWLPAGAWIVGALFYWMAFCVPGFRGFLAFEFFAEVALATGLPAAFAAVHAVCGNQRRATAIAAVLLLMSLCGNGLGPLVVGTLSDALSRGYGLESLKYSMIAAVVFLLPAAGALCQAGRDMVEELEL